MNLLLELVDAARATIASGYYRSTDEIKQAPSLARAIREAQLARDPALIAEIKPATPIKGRLVDGGYGGLMTRFLQEGACGLSVVTEPKHFHGSLANLKLAVSTKAPVLMKDFILDEKQIDCAASFGASAVLLIASILPKTRVTRLIEYAQLSDREVLLECSSRAEVEAALATDAEIIGVNNRDLKSFHVDLDRTRTFTQNLDIDRPLVSLSGFETRDDVLRVQGVADAILVGTSLIEQKTTVAELIGA